MSINNASVKNALGTDQAVAVTHKRAISLRVLKAVGVNSRRFCYVSLWSPSPFGSLVFAC